MRIFRIDHARRYPPRVTQFTAPFWSGLSDGVFTTTRCAACRRLSFPPKPICPHCWKDTVEWERLATRGTLYSWTRIHAGPAIFADDLPYSVGIVDLDVGIRLGCALLEQPEPWTCDMKVNLITLAYSDGPLLGAHPAQEPAVD